MPDYVNVPIETDPDALAQDAFDYLGAKTDGAWTPHDGELDTWQIEANARMAATVRDLASDVPTAIFRYFGQIVGVPPEAGVSATATSTWNLGDSLGHTIPAGSHVGVADDSGNLIDFQTVYDTVVAAGSATVSGVLIAATDEGAAGSGLGGSGVTALLLDSFAWVDTVILEAKTAGGVDEEDDPTYLNRLTANLQLMAPRPILPNDFALMALNIIGIGRALALDGYDPVTATYGNAREISIALVDASGMPVSTSLKNSVQSYLAAQRESTFIVNSIDATYTTIDVQWDVDAWPNWDPVDLNTRINAAVAAHYSPANWGNPPFGDIPQWFNTPVAKINDLIGAIGATQGVKVVNSATQRIGTNAYAAADINLPGAAPLAQSGVVSGTVH